MSDIVWGGEDMPGNMWLVVQNFASLQTNIGIIELMAVPEFQKSGQSHAAARTPKVSRTARRFGRCPHWKIAILASMFNL